LFPIGRSNRLDLTGEAGVPEGVGDAAAEVRRGDDDVAARLLSRTPTVR